MPKQPRIIGYLMGHPIYEVDDPKLRVEGELRCGTLTKEAAERVVRHQAAEALADATLVWLPGEGN